jgi:hypothetical protein
MTDAEIKEIAIYMAWPNLTKWEYAEDDERSCLVSDLLSQIEIFDVQHQWDV